MNWSPRLCVLLSLTDQPGRVGATTRPMSRQQPNRRAREGRVRIRPRSTLRPVHVFGPSTHRQLADATERRTANAIQGLARANDCNIRGHLALDLRQDVVRTDCWRAPKPAALLSRSTSQPCGQGLPRRDQIPARVLQVRAKFAGLDSAMRPTWIHGTSSRQRGATGADTRAC